jgi:hypothetical protein
MAAVEDKLNIMRTQIGAHRALSASLTIDESKV